MDLKEFVAIVVVDVIVVTRCHGALSWCVVVSQTIWQHFGIYVVVSAVVVDVAVTVDVVAAAAEDLAVVVVFERNVVLLWPAIAGIAFPFL